MIQHLEILIDCLLFNSEMVTFILEEILFDKYDRLLVERKDFNALIGNKPFFYQPVKNQQKVYEKLI